MRTPPASGFPPPNRSMLNKEHALELPTRHARLIRKLRRRTGLTRNKFAAELGVTFLSINR